LAVKIGVLALQGAFREHINAIKKCECEAVEIKFADDLEDIDGLIIPGGESTTMVKLIEKYNFRPALDRFYNDKKPIFGTCAGLILLARKVDNLAFCLNYIDIEVDRNAYGRQVESFEVPVKLNSRFFIPGEDFKAVFIRAPKIIKSSEKVQALASLDSCPVLAKQESILVCSFHPELTDDLRIHMYFAGMVKSR
jgi:pyridoxal 5'-phosphate synthase pdxT subunit